jgi:hypothetical protein
MGMQVKDCSSLTTTAIAASTAHWWPLMAIDGSRAVVDRNVHSQDIFGLQEWKKSPSHKCLAVSLLKTF